MAANLQLVPAAACKRPGAAVIHWLPPLAVLMVTFILGFAGITRARSGGLIIYDTASLVLFGGIGLGLTVVYLFVVAGVEARTGKTPGNLLMGIRSADNELSIRLDDGRNFQVDRRALVGRNPVGQSGEQHAQPLAVDDPGRSISKTHLHLLTDGAGIWVTVRNSTNGSAVSTPDGVRIPLQPGVPAIVKPGSSAPFGDRTFHLGQA